MHSHPLQQRLAVHRAGGDSKTDLDDLIIRAVQPNTVDLQSRIDLRLSEKVRAENCSDFSHIFPNDGIPFTFCVDISLSAKSFVDLTEL